MVTHPRGIINRPPWFNANQAVPYTLDMINEPCRQYRLLRRFHMVPHVSGVQSTVSCVV